MINASYIYRCSGCHNSHIKILGEIIDIFTQDLLPHIGMFLSQFYPSRNLSDLGPNVQCYSLLVHDFMN